MKETIHFVGEHLWAGNLGHAAVVLACFASLGAAIFYFLTDRNTQYKTIARSLLLTHIVAVFAIIVILFVIIYNHWFEYQYAWQHSSRNLPWYYMISCFWEGQEGSFLLWIFWNAILCLILLKKAKDWEPQVLCIVALVQFSLSGMLLGIHFNIGETMLAIGSSPFELLREKSPSLLNLPVMQQVGKANYLHAIQDGNGLNPLLQNYWMVIHPPTLFSGFACTVIPFAYAIAALWKNRTREWITASLPYVLITVLVLGVGIMMGGYWAYESLSFGGYWAWDPVENASLMPWVLMLVTLHILLISKARGTYIGLSLLLAISSFIMVLYATFLTRSGILGDSSVHSFVDLGLSGQLLIFLGLFFTLGYGIYIYKAITNKINPNKSAEEKLASREFWMFIGALVLVLSLLHIIGATSIPVYNKIFGTHIAPHANPVAYYNSWQMPFALVILLLMGTTQFFNYRDTPKKEWQTNIATILVISLACTLLAIYLFEIRGMLNVVFLFSAIYAIAGNLTFIVKKLKGKISFSGASIAHVGFGLMLLGVLVSSVNKNVISYNNTGANYMREDDKKGEDRNKAIEFNRENILLEKGKTVKIAGYSAKYVGDSFMAPNKYFIVEYKKLGKNNEIKEEFTLMPSMQSNEKMGGPVSNPDTRHYLSKDIFTHVNHESGLDKTQEWKDLMVHNIQKGDTFFTKDALHRLVLVDIINEGSADGKLVSIKPVLKLTTINEEKTIYPNIILDLEKLAASADYNSAVEKEPVILDEEGLKIELSKLSVIDKTSTPLLEFTTMQRQPKVDYIILKAIVFPWINLLWLGTIVMMIGFIISIARRVKDNKMIKK